MRLLYFTRSWTGHDDRFARAFRAHGIELGIITLQLGTTARIRSILGEETLFVHELEVQNSLDEVDIKTLACRYLELENMFSPEVVVAGPLTDCAYIKAISDSKVPWMAQSWAFDVFWEAGRTPEAYKRCQRSLSACTWLFADCYAVVRECERIARGQLKGHFVMPWGLVPSNSGTPASRRSIRCRMGLEGRHVFVHSRGLEDVYGIQTLVEGFCVHAQADSSACLLLASDGSLRGYVEAYIADHGLRDNILLMGRLPHEDVLELFHAADSYVSCALSDGTSISLLEAMDAGLPALVPALGGNDEWIKNGTTGWLVPPADSAALARALHAASTLTAAERRILAEKHKSILHSHANWPANFNGFVHRLSVLASGEPLPA